MKNTTLVLLVALLVTACAPIFILSADPEYRVSNFECTLTHYEDEFVHEYNCVEVVEL